jgi:Ca2+-binding RTX toxin-like protein
MTVQVITGNDLANTLSGTGSRDVIYGFDPNGPQGNVSAITATRVASGLTQPLFAAAAPNDPERLFIVEKTGAIKILDLKTGDIKSQAFLDLSNDIVTSGERGLLGLAFDPGFANNGFFYVSLINKSGDTEIRRYEVSSGSPNRADPSSGMLILTVDQPSGRTNHKAGWLGFGQDGMLYAALGDGGGAGDPDSNGQDINTLLGKMLRLDVSADAFPRNPQRNYSIPSDNPFVGVAGADEIYALGLRNPWRNSFDRGTGDLYIADVGQQRWEEINLGAPGANYGWKIFEGPEEFSPETPNGGGVLTEPVHFYSNEVGNSITGGYVYRGSSEGLQGHYFFADFADNKIFTMLFDGADWVADERTSQIQPNVGAINAPASFGEDAEGNLYLVDLDGEVFRLTPNVVSADKGDTINAGGGNDLVFGGSGHDVINGQSGNDELHGGDDNDQLLGAAGNDLLFGGRGNDAINGGSGADTMVGQSGNDTYVVDHVKDKVIEAPRRGTDTVSSSVTFSLAGQHVENLTLTATGNINATGNGLANKLTGNSGNNVIDGGTGADTMAGNSGRDRYFVDNTGDVVIEASGDGTDRVISTVSFSLGGQHIERLTLDGTGNVNGTGNILDNVITANSGSNILRGKAGNDTLTGGGAADVFRFNTALNAATNVDTITDFQVNLHKIQLENAIFTQVGPSLAASEFVANTSGAATTGAHNILYDTTDGRLFYDPDGTGAAARIHFATLKAGLALDHLDFVVT